MLIDISQADDVPVKNGVKVHLVVPGPPKLRSWDDHPGSSRGNHGPIIGAPAAPHIATAVPAKSATRTAGAVTVTVIAVTGSMTEVAAKVIAAKNITFATAAARECVGGKPGTSENKDNCKNDYGVAQH